MKVRAGGIPDIRILEPDVFRDERGLFFESYNARVLSDLGIPATFVQDNHSRSRRHVVRGLHYQLRRPQGKLIHVVAGEVLDVAVDIRPASATFGQHVALVLSSETREIVWIPPGFAHGFAVRSEVCDLVYKTTGFYAPEDERAILWSDPDLGIEWGVTGEPILSARDRSAPPLAHAELPTGD